MNTGNLIAIMGAGLVGSLGYAFTDTFWFSAVEGEVYAMSSFLTALVFWAILKWENIADEPHANRWLILIAYLIGLSIGVHLLNLLAIPAIVFVYYFRKYEVNHKRDYHWHWRSPLLSSADLCTALFQGLSKSLHGSSFCLSTHSAFRSIPVHSSM
jgi:hypothetical protein